MQVEVESFCDTKQPVLGFSAGSPNGGKHFVAEQGKCISSWQSLNFRVFSRCRDQKSLFFGCATNYFSGRIQTWLEQHWESVWHFLCWWGGWEPSFVPVAPFPSQLEQIPVFLPEPSSPGGIPVWSSSAPVGHSSCCHLWVLCCLWNSCLTLQTHFQPTGDTLGFEAVLIHKENPGSKHRKICLGKGF